VVQNVFGRSSGRKRDMMKLRIQSIRLQLTFWYVGSIRLLVIVFGGITFFSLQAILMKNLDQTLYNGAKILGESLSDYTLHDEENPQSLYESSEGEEILFVDTIDEEVNEGFFVHVTYAQLVALLAKENGLVIARTATLADRTLPLSRHAYRARDVDPYVVETVTGIFPFALRMMTLQVHDQDERPYLLQVALSLQDLHATLRGLLMIVAILFPVLLATLSGLGYLFMKRTFAPVRSMVALTKRITAEDLALRLEPLESHDEIGELAETLNGMIARLERSFKQIRQFSGDVSHELKTPLAELKCNAEVALRKERAPEEYQIALHNVIEDTEQLQKIVEDLLFLARMDSQSLPLSFTILALQEIFLEVFEHSHLLAKHKNLALEFQDIKSVSINGDSGLLKRLFTNLMLNAIQYTPSGGEITFSLRKQTNQAVFTVTDTGIGIPEECLPHIFDRFYRVEQSRSHETGGSGLGLAIVQKILELHQGRIFVHSTVGKGTTFRVVLPCHVIS
jgi:heavy metal sensor kinase